MLEARSDARGLSDPALRVPFLDTRVCTAIIVLALITLLILNVFVIGPIQGDTGDYLVLTDSLVENLSFSKHSVDGKPVPDIIRTPGYPVFLAVLKVLFGDPKIPARILQPLMLLGTSLMLLRELQVRYGRRTANLTMILMLAIPQYYSYSNQLMSESLAMSGFLLAVLLGIRNGSSALTSIACGLVLGYSVLCRANMIFVLGPLFLMQWLDFKNRRGAILMVVSCGLVLVPWAARNYIAFGKPTIVQPAKRHIFLARYIETFYGLTQYGALPNRALPREKRFSEELVRDGFKERNERINESLGVRPDAVTLFFSINSDDYPTLELQDRVSAENDKWERDLRAEKGLFGMLFRRMFLVAPLGWVTKNYDMPFGYLIGPVLLSANIAILVMGFLAWKVVFGYRLILLLPGYVLCALISGAVPSFLVLLPSLIYLAMRWRSPDADLLTTISLPILVHYQLLPMVMHLEGRYVRPTTPFLCLLAALTILTIVERYLKARSQSGGATL